MRLYKFLLKNGYSIIFAILIALITLVVLEYYSPLFIWQLGYSWFGDIWRIFVTPGIKVLILPSSFLTQVVAWMVPGLTMAGFADDGPIDVYFYFILAMLLGTSYSILITIIIRILKKLGAKFVR